MELCVVTGLVMSRLRRFRLALLIQNFLGVCGYHNAQGDSRSLTPFSFHAEFIRLDSSSLCSPSSCTKPAVILSSLSVPSPPTLLGTFFRQLTRSAVSFPLTPVQSSQVRVQAARRTIALVSSRTSSAACISTWAFHSMFLAIAASPTVF
jgi:hypothetical protein